MPIDFSKLAAPKDIIVPILNNSFQYHKKKYSLSNAVDDGWWVVSIEGNKATSKEPYIYSEVKTTDRSMFGYTYHNQIIFQNQDVVRRKFNIRGSVPLYFNQADTFSSIKTIAWEDGKFYFAEINYADIFIYEVKNAFDENKSVSDIKGITPELRSLYLYHDLEKQQILELQRIEDLQKQQEELLKTISGRLTITLKRAGAELIDWSMSGNRIVFNWRLETGNYTYNSVLDSNTWKMLECGFCMSHDDKRHNITSMVKTAEIYEENGAIYITRS